MATLPDRTVDSDHGPGGPGPGQGAGVGRADPPQFINRGQAELFTPDMVNWNNYLERSAREMDQPIIDTSALTPEQLARDLAKLMARG